MKLTKDQLKRKSEIFAKISELAGVTEAAYAAACEKLRGILSPVDEAVSKYNDALTEAEELASEIALEAQDNYDDKSEKWQESDAGQSLFDFQAEWQTDDFGPVEWEPPELTELPETGHAELLSHKPEKS